MSENYTVEDFERAPVATRGNTDMARRTSPGDAYPWLVCGSEHGWQSDKGMADNGWTPVVESRITLDSLEAAWEAAEVPTDDDPIRAGDVAIEKISDSAYAVMSPPPTCGLVGREFRVLSRAPREPWQDLADILREDGLAFEEDIEGIVKRLHERGVRVTGGDDDE